MARLNFRDTRTLAGVGVLVIASLGLVVGFVYAIGHVLGLGLPFQWRGYLVVGGSLLAVLLGSSLLRTPSLIWQIPLRSAALASGIVGVVMLVNALPQNLGGVLTGCVLIGTAFLPDVAMKWLRRRAGS